MADLLPGLALALTLAINHEEALRATKGSCQPCHRPILTSQEISDRPDRPAKRVKFPHELHLKLGNIIAPAIAKAIDSKQYLSPNPTHRPHLDNVTNLCAACHRQMTTATETTAKSHYPHMSDCLVCHNKIDAPFSCKTCHFEDAKSLQPANHTSGFIDRHTNKNSGLDKSECASCHGRQFTCLGCH